MSKAITVRDVSGNVVVRDDGVFQDGDKLLSVRVPLMFTDSTGRVSSATLGSAIRILGDSYDETEYAGMTDQAARYAVVRKRLGSGAEGRSAAFLDAAWNALAGTGGSTVAAPVTGVPPLPVLTDAQKAFAADAVKRAVRDANGSPGRPLKPAAPGDASRGAYDAMRREMQDGWKGGAAQAPVTLDARMEKAVRDQGGGVRTRAYAEMMQGMSDGWKTPRA